jgi:hypothetical protein
MNNGTLSILKLQLCRIALMMIGFYCSFLAVSYVSVSPWALTNQVDIFGDEDLDGSPARQVEVVDNHQTRTYRPIHSWARHSLAISSSYLFKVKSVKYLGLFKTKPPGDFTILYGHFRI